MTKLITTTVLLVAACGAPARQMQPEYADALQRYLRTGSTHQVGLELALDDGDASELIRKALVDLQRRYYSDR